jgi:hypothetical protein
MDAPSPTHCYLVVPLLQGRDGSKTKVELSGRRTLDVLNIAWGEDIGDDYEHITSNISPSADGRPFDLFFTDEIVRIMDPVSGAVLWETDGTPKVRVPPLRELG